MEKLNLLWTKEFPFISEIERKAGETEKHGHLAQKEPQQPPRKLSRQEEDQAVAVQKEARQTTPFSKPREETKYL